MNAPLTVYLCEPRGFCAGVERAIEIVELALKKYGPPIYVRHEIVHNKWVVEDLRGRGVIFVEDVSEVPDGGITIFSAHGISEKVEDSARLRELPVIDATCPLVTKVHHEAQRYEKEGRQIVLIGHEGHPEVEGTSGRVKTRVYLVQNELDAENLIVEQPENLAYVTQTTLSVDDTRGIITVLERRFPGIKGPALRDICYATQNRQNAVKALKDKVQLLLVIGSTNSSNSNRLRDLGEEMGIESYLIPDASALDPAWLQGKSALGITAGASAPEHLVEGLVTALRNLIGSGLQVMPLETARETTRFKLPPGIAGEAA